MQFLVSPEVRKTVIVEGRQHFKETDGIYSAEAQIFSDMPAKLRMSK